VTSLRMMAAFLGVSHCTVWRDLQNKDRGAARSLGRDGKSYPSRRGLFVPAVWMCELRAQGWSYRRIAAEAGVSHQTVMRLFRNLELVQVSRIEQVDQENTVGEQGVDGSGVSDVTGGPA
jgi:hypothetical protein